MSGTPIVVDRSESAREVNRVLLTTLDEFLPIAKALSSEIRVEILKKLLAHPMSVTEIAECFQLPASTAAVNIKKLEDAGLIRTELVPGSRGTQKLCAAVFSRIVINARPESEGSASHVIIPMPIGHFFDFQVAPTCGILSDTGIIGEIDDPRSFYEPDRVNAQLIWFRKGFVEYRFPNRVPHGASATNLELSMEVCSEAPLHNPNWPSDITVWINGVEVGTWTSPGDFGGERGLLTPEWWGIQNTQYGLLKTWRVNQEGAFVDGRPVSPITIGDLALDGTPTITVRIGVKDDAVNDGGINLFGRKFGNYETDLVMRLDYVHKEHMEEGSR